MTTKAKVLVVDDLEENVLALQALLEDDGVDVLAAGSGPAALELLLQHDVALALVDVQMPEMDGFELAEFMRGTERTRRVPIIFVSAAARDRNRVFHGYDAGAVDYLVKPLEPHVLRSKVNVFVELHQQRRELAEQIVLLSRATEEREALLKELKETLKLNELFVGVVGHDLRSPLSAILTAAALLEATNADPAVHKVSSRLRSIGTRMSRLINDLLDLTRARLAGGIPVHPVRTDLTPVITGLVEECRLASPNRVFDLRITGDLVADVDGDRLAQAMGNLLQNAAVHGTGGTPVRVTVDGRDGEVIGFSVGNDGAVPAHELTRLFDPFAQGAHVDGQRPRSPGLGLGLFIVDQIVRAHGGTSEAISKDGRTTFGFAVPRHRVGRSTPVLPARSTPTPTPTPTH